MQGVILFVFVLVLIIIAIAKSMPKSDTSFVRELDPNAKVTDMKTERVGKNFETTVYFSDGYRYITRDHDEQPGFGVITRSVTTEVRMRILKDAIERHNEEYEKYKERKNKYGHV